jgi:pyruvate dehydrogenase E2 component (dihydrolipoamide acetyltransferase)
MMLRALALRAPRWAPARLAAQRAFSSDLPEHEFLHLPSLSPTMESGVITRWNKAEGDKISADDIIAEIETDKAVVDYAATEDGYLAKILQSEGSGDLAVGTVIGVTVEEEADIAAFADYQHADAATAPPAAPAAPPAAPAAPPAPPALAPAATKAANAGDRVFASPLARIEATRRGIDIAHVLGSGPGGRVVRADVDELPDGYGAGASAAHAAGATPDSYVSSSTAAFSDADLSQARKVIARNTTLSKQTVPHYYLTIDVEIDELLAARAGLNERAAPEARLSVNDFIIKASALACRDVPECNSSWQGDSIRQYHHVDVNVGMSVGDSGLVSPVVRDCASEGLAAISARVKDLAGRARENALTPADHETGTFTISTLGMYGVKNFCGIISPPQACILAVGAGTDRLLPAAAGSAAEHRTAKVMSVTLSCDHRVVDGAVGAQWLQAFKGYIENPVTMLL